MSDQPIFALMPIEAFLDRRLTLEQLRVLGVLFSFRGKNSNTIWPKRQTISERCGMHLSNISTATSALERLGWLTKNGKGGHSKSTRYTITVPETVAQSATVAEQATVAHAATSTVADQATRMPVARSATRKEVNQEQTKGTDQTRERARAAQPSGSKTKTADTTLGKFLEACKAAGEKPITDEDPIFEYAEKVGIDHEMLAICWREFKGAFLPTAKRQKDWRAHFRNAVRRNWYKLWFLREGEAAGWTTAGEQARREAA